MKKLTIFLGAICLSMMAIAQTAGFSYQAVVRNAAGELVKNKTIGMRITILQGTAGGAAVYTETASPATNINGLATLEIGKANLTAFSAINWANGPYFLKTETDPNGGTGYSISGTSQLLNVPYAMYAVKAGNGVAATLVSTMEAANITTTTATCGGTVFISTGDVIAYGVCWGTAQNPTIDNSKTNNGTGLGNFASAIAGLTPGTTYYARAYATTSFGTTYGNQVTFKTFLTVVFPTVTTTAAGNITEYSAASGGNVTSTGGADVTAKGVCWSTNQNPTIADTKTSDGTGAGQYSSQLASLNPGSTYYVRAYATNSSGTGYGNQVTLTALKTTPTVITKNITDISAMGAVSGGMITQTGGGTISDKGICWGEAENPTVDDNKISAGTGTATFNSAIVTAVPGKTYYLRAYAKNEMGIVYGQQKTFTALINMNYYGFESGMKPAGWGGTWTVTNERSFEGSYSLKSLNSTSSDATLTINIANSGQISFYSYFTGGVSIEFYIDDILKGSFPANSGWVQGLSDVSVGNHVFKWHFDKASIIGCNCNAFIDYIVLPK